MKVYVNEQPVEIFRGMTVRHALLSLNLLDELSRGKRVYDQWGNEVGLDGELSEGERIYVLALQELDKAD
ncbi:hypothetical protein [Thermodesulfovibrio sp.]|uniref:hypothetical protein n=1 Tax=Thermodesulfovibrio sp. TaxID=2067987 RepID=UPI0030979A19